MLQTLKLLLPALLPSWRFFDFIAPSPRIQFCLFNATQVSTTQETPRHWHEFLPRPAHLSFLQMLGRIFWNPQWNETLFLVSCAERLLENPTKHSEDEILKRIIQEITDSPSDNFVRNATHLQFRLLLIQRQGTQLQQTIEFQSRIEPLPAQETP